MPQLTAFLEYALSSASLRASTNRRRKLGKLDGYRLQLLHETVCMGVGSYIPSLIVLLFRVRGVWDVDSRDPTCTDHIVNVAAVALQRT